MKVSQHSNGYKLEAGELEGASVYQLLELRYGYFVQATGDLAESCGPVRLKGGLPTDKSLPLDRFPESEVRSQKRATLARVSPAVLV